MLLLWLFRRMNSSETCLHELMLAEQICAHCYLVCVLGLGLHNSFWKMDQQPRTIHLVLTENLLLQSSAMEAWLWISNTWRWPWEKYPVSIGDGSVQCEPTLYLNCPVIISYTFEFYISCQYLVSARPIILVRDSRTGLWENDQFLYLWNSVYFNWTVQIKWTPLWFHFHSPQGIKRLFKRMLRWRSKRPKMLSFRLKSWSRSRSTQRHVLWWGKNPQQQQQHRWTIRRVYKLKTTLII